MRKVKHIIVTGGAGFIGSHIVERLISQGYKVTVLDNLSTGYEENIPQKAEFIKLDLGLESSYEVIKKLKCDAVFHLAGQSSGEGSFADPDYDFRSHVFSTFKLLEWGKEIGINRFIYASSMAVYGDPVYLPVDENHPLNPKTFYAAAKISAETYINLYQTLGINTTIFRLFSIYGPGQNLTNKRQGMISIFLSYMLQSDPIIVKGSPERFRDFTYIDDVVDLWLMALDNQVTFGRSYNIATGVKTTVKGLLNHLKISFGNQYYPIRIMGGTPGDQFGIVGDITQISNDLKWKARIDLKTGIDKMVNIEKEKFANKEYEARGPK